MTHQPAPGKPHFCSECGVKFLPDAQFCHTCGAPVGGRAPGGGQGHAFSPWLRWGIPAAAVLALVIVSFFRIIADGPAPESGGAVALGTRAMNAPDISSMSPVERADRLFNRVMTLSSDGKADSVAFFAPMALNAIEALGPPGAHSRYDMGLVSLVAGDAAGAAAQSDAILSERPDHLLGLALAARAADARNDSTAGRAFRQRLLAAEKTERASALPEYADHDADIRAAVELARSR